MIARLKIPILILLAVIILAGLFFLLRPKTPVSAPVVVENKPAPEITETVTPTPMPANSVELVVQNKKIVSGPSTISVKQDDEVTIQITSDEEDEFHVHGYNRYVELSPGAPAMIKFKAETSGRFPFELEMSKVEIGVLEVQPK